MNATKEIIENNLNKKINLNIAFNEEKIKKILSQNGVKKEIIDKINGNYITKKEKESVSLFEINSIINDIFNKFFFIPHYLNLTIQ